MPRSVILGVFGAALCLAVPLDASASSILFTTYTGESTVSSNVNRTIGTGFTVGPVDLLVLRLGYYDAGLDGLVEDHIVAIWRVSDQALVGSAVVAAGTGGAVIEDWRFVDASGLGLVLSANTTYRIAGYRPTNVDPEPVDGTFLAGPGIAAINPTAVFGGTLGFVYPNGGGSAARVNANAEVQAVPEPATASLLVLGFIISALGRQRRN